MRCGRSRPAPWVADGSGDSGGYSGCVETMGDVVTTGEQNWSGDQEEEKIKAEEKAEQKEDTEANTEGGAVERTSHRRSSCMRNRRKRLIPSDAV